MIILTDELEDELENEASEVKEQGTVGDETNLFEIKKILSNSRWLIYSSVLLIILVGCWIYLARVRKK